MKKFAVLFILLISTISLVAQTSRTWTGSTSTDWNTAANWSPSGVPSSSDHIILNTASGNQPLLDANHSITNITVSAGTLNLNGYTLTITGTTSLTGGNINNGRATFSNSSTTVAGTTFGAIVTITASTVSLSNSTYNSKVIITKTGTSSDVAGGNTYNDTLDIRLQNGSLGMATTGNDTYNSDVYVSNTSTGFIALGSSGSFGCTLASGKKVLIGSAGFNSGQLYFRKFTQTGTTPQSITLGGTSTQLYISNISVFNATLALQAPFLNIGASTFNKKVTLIKTGSAAETHSGGNTFNDTLDIRTQSGGIIMAGSGNDVYNGDVYVSNTGTSFIALGSSGSFGCTLATGKKILIGSGGFNSGQLYLRRFTQSGSTPQSITLGGTTTSFIISNSCVFNGKLTLQAPTFDLGNSTYNNKVIITKTGTSNETHGGGNTFNDTLDIRLQAGGTIIAGSGNDAYNGDVYVSNTGAGFLALGSSGSYGCTLATGKKLYIGSAGFSNGILYLRRFTQNGSTAQSITLGGSTTQCIINNATTFNSNFTIEAPNVLIDGSTFNGSLSVTKNGSSSNTWYTANTYNGNVSITNSGTGFINMSNMSSGGDVYNGNATFTKSSTGDVIIAGNASTVTFKGDVTLNNISSNQFTGSQVALFTGTAAQTLNQSSSALNFGRVTINKASNNLTLNAPLTVSNALTLTSGKIITTGTNLLNLADNATVSSASNSSYVQGPMSKTGNDAFTFPMGKAGNYRPIGITAPSSTSTIFTAEYVDANQTLGTSADTSIANLSDCEHWTLTRSGSTSNVNVTLAWNSASCNGAVATNMRVAGWNGTTWTNYGNGARTGNATAGTVTSNTNPTAYNVFALTNKNCTGVATITPSGATSFCSGGNVTLTAPAGAKKYSWLPSGITQSINASASNSYIVKVADTLGCVGKDTVDVTVWVNPTVNAGSDTVIVVGDTIQLNATVGSGTSPYSYLWTPSTGLSSTTVANPFAHPDTLTDYIVRVTDANGCVKKDTVRIYALKISFTMSNDSIEAGDSIVFTNTSILPVGTTYYWDFGDCNTVDSTYHNWDRCKDTIVGTGSATYFYDNEGNYTATLRVMGPLGYLLSWHSPVTSGPIISPPIGDASCQKTCVGHFNSLGLFNITGPGQLNKIKSCWRNIKACGSQGSPDLFHTNTNSLQYGIPVNEWGTQPNSGTNIGGYGGIIAYKAGSPTTREYIVSKLPTPIAPGESVELLFDINLADCSKYAAEVQAVFSQNEYCQSSASLVFLTGFFSGLLTDIPYRTIRGGSNLIDNKDGWVTYKINYTNNSAQSMNWVTIGNFFNDANTTKQLVGNFDYINTLPSVSCIYGAGNNYAYYYIDNIVVNKVKNCCEGSDVTIDNATASSLWTNPDFDDFRSGTSTNMIISNSYNNNPSSNTIAIRGTFTIDIPNFKFDNCHVKLATDARIVISGSALSSRTFTIEDSWLHACESYLWDGIYINNNFVGSPNKTLVLTDSKIEDAKNAIVSEKGGVYTLSGSTLNKNLKHIVVNAYPYQHAGTIVSTTLKCTSTLLPLFNTYINRTKTHVGIEINNVIGITVGNDNTSGNRNFLSDAIYGIRTTESKLLVRNTTFDGFSSFNSVPDLAPYQFNSTYNESFGIITYGSSSTFSSLNVLSNGNTDPATNIFKNSTAVPDDPIVGGLVACGGIFARDYMTLNVVGNKFQNLYTGITDINNTTQNIAISKNKFENVQLGATTAFFIGTNAEVSDNTFTYTGFDNGISYGIGHYISVPNMGSYKMLSNSMLDYQYGIYSNNLTLFDIIDNDINTQNYSNIAEPPTNFLPANQNAVYGMLIQNHNQGRVINNTVVGIPGPTPTDGGLNTFEAMRFINSYRMSVFCNNINVPEGGNTDIGTFGRGIMFEQQSYPVALKGNNIGDCQYGIGLINAGDIGPQSSNTISSENQWRNGPTSPYGNLLNDTYSYNTNGNNNRFYVRNVPNFVPITNNPTGGFPIPVSTISGAIFSCPAPVLFTADELKNNAHWIINDTNNYYAFDEEIKYDDNYNLYRMAQTYSDSLVGDTVIENYIDSLGLTNIGTLYTIEQLLYVDLYDSLRVVADTVFEATDSTDFAIKWFVADSMALADAYDLLDGITPANFVEETYKVLNTITANAYKRIYFPKDAKEVSPNNIPKALTKTEIDTLNYYARQCELLYGDGVYTIRGLLMGVSDSLFKRYIGYMGNCEPDSGSMRLAQFDEDVPVGLVKIYPNPTNGNVFVQLPKGANSLTIQVYNALGVYLQSNTVTGPLAELNLNNYTNGLYIIRIFDSKGKEIESKKVSLQR